MVSLLLSIHASFSVLAAETPTIYINEVLIEPTQQVEIINSSTSKIDLSGWYIDDEGGTTYFTIADGTYIEPNSCIVIEGKFNLNKASTDTIRLFDAISLPTDSQSQPIDFFTYDTSPGESRSFQRTPDGTSNWIATSQTLGKWNSSLKDCQIIPSPPPTMTIVPTPTKSPSPTSAPSVTNIRLSEAFVYPNSGETEWIELYNPNDFQVILQNWYIDDAADDGSSPKKIILEIPAKGYNVYHLSTGIYNNSGDTVRLLNSSNQLIDSFSYVNATKGLSVGRSEILTDSVCEQEPTEGYENENCLSRVTAPTNTPVPSPTMRISEATTSQQIPSDDPSDLYYIRVIYPRPSKYEDVNTLGTEDHIDFSKDSADNKPFEFLPAGYSLLSIISLAVKMKLK